MMFISIGLGVAMAAALIVVVSVLTGGTVKGASAPAPALVGKTLQPWSQQGLNGAPVAAPWNTGHPTVVVVFASWCTPCRQELPQLATYLARHHLGKVSLLGVDVQDTPAKATAFLHQYHVTMTSISDPQASVYGRFLLSGIPDTIFVNAKGVVQNMTIGAITPTQFAAGVAALNA